MVPPRGYELRRTSSIGTTAWLWVAAIVVIVAGVQTAGAGSGETTPSAATVTVPVFEGQKENDTVVPVGHLVTLDDDVLTTTTPLVETPAENGAPMACSTVTILNNGEDSTELEGDDEWELTAPDGDNRPATPTGNAAPLDSGELPPGGTVTGDVCFDMPEAHSGAYAVIYAPEDWSRDRAVWIDKR